MKFHYARHKRLWNWLAKDPGHRKSRWPEWQKYEYIDIPIQYCFACEFAAHRAHWSPRRLPHLSPRALCLKYCPLDWGKGGTCLQLKGEEYGSGLYYLWENTDNQEMRVQYARQIAELPLKKWAEEYV